MTFTDEITALVIRLVLRAGRSDTWSQPHLGLIPPIMVTHWDSGKHKFSSDLNGLPNTVGIRKPHICIPDSFKKRTFWRPVQPFENRTTSMIRQLRPWSQFPTVVVVRIWVFYVRSSSPFILCVHQKREDISPSFFVTRQHPPLSPISLPILSVSLLHSAVTSRPRPLLL